MRMVTAQNVNIPTNLFNYSLAFCLLVTGKIVAEVGLNEKKMKLGAHLAMTAMLLGMVLDLLSLNSDKVRNFWVDFFESPISEIVCRSAGA